MQEVISMPNIRIEDIQNSINELKAMLEDYAMDNTASNSKLEDVGRQLEHLCNEYFEYIQSIT